MNKLSKLMRWEAHIERSPMSLQIRLYASCFFVSLLVGVLIATYFSYLRTSTIRKVAADIKTLELTRMDSRIEQLRIKLARQ